MGRSIKDAAQDYFGGSIPEVRQQSFSGTGSSTASSAIQEAAQRWERRNEPDEYQHQWNDEGDEYVSAAYAAVAKKKEAEAEQPKEEKKKGWFTKAVDRLLGIDSNEVTGEKTNWWDVIKGSASKGLNTWNSLNWKTANFLFGDAAEELHTLGTETINQIIEGLNTIPGVNLNYLGQSRNLVKWGYDDAQAGLQAATDKYAANANSSRAAQVVDNLGTGFVAALPMAIEAWLLGPAQAAQQGAAATSSAGLQYFSGLQSAKGLDAAGMMARQGMKKLFQNPQFWTSYLQVAGDGYEDALEDGMSGTDAAVYGLINGFFNATIEIGGADETLGGIQNLPMRLAQMQEQGGKRAVVEWFKDSVLGEGLEEVQQGVFERGLKSFFGQDTPVFSTDPTDTKAIFNPWTAGQEFTGGAVVGGLLGGAQVGATNAVDRATGRAAAREQAAQAKQQARAAQTQQQAQQSQQQAAQDTARAFVRQSMENLGLSEEGTELLVSNYEAGETDAQRYVAGVKEAFNYGKMGLSLEQAREEASFAADMSPQQFEQAHRLGELAGGNRSAEKVSSRAYNTPQYESIEAFSREFRNPQAVTNVYDMAADTDVNEFAEGFRAAYDMGQSGVSESYLTGTDASGAAYVPTLTEEQRALAFEMGRQDAATDAGGQAQSIRSQQQGGKRRVKGTVKGEGVSMADLKAAFNDPQRTAYRLLTRYAEATGVNIVLYNSQADANGVFTDAQGRFQWKDDTIYIDINSGLSNMRNVNDLGQYTMMRTFAHEFTHFIEKWSPAKYNEFREFVFSALEAKGENVHDLIESKQAEDESGSLNYEQASREVVADAMMDILPDTALVQQLASQHQDIFRKLLQKLREFTARLKQYYREISSKAPREAQALKENGAYMQSIVDMWEAVARDAVVNYQGARGEAITETQKTARNSQKTVKAEQETVREEAPKTRPVTRDRFPANDFTSREENAEDVRQQAGVTRLQTVGRDRFAPNDFTSREETGPDLRQQAGVQKIKPVGRERFAPNDLTSREETGERLLDRVPKRTQEEEEEFLNFDPQTVKAELERRKREGDTSDVDAMLRQAETLWEATQEQETEAEPETTAEAESPARRQDTPEGAELRARLEVGDAEVNGLSYEIFGMGSTTIDVRDNRVSSGREYRASIRRVDRSSGVPVYDGREMYRETFPTRAEAVDALVAVAENNHFLEERQEKTDGKPNGTADEGKAGNDDARLDEGGKRVRSGSPGRKAPADSSELQPSEGRVQERGDGGESDVPPTAGHDREAEADRDGRDDRNGDGGGLQGRGHASGSVRKNGGADSGIQRTVPLKPKGKQNVNNYRIEEDIDSIRPNFDDNLAAIKLVKKLIEENRSATPEERAVLAKYKGWGGLKNYILNKNGYWARVLQSVLTPEEYEAARDSVLNAHYTSTKIISGIYRAVQRFGFKGGNILEPSMGVGNFFGMLPQNLSSKSSLYGVELDKITGTIAKNLYPDARIDVAGFQDVLYGDGTFDLVVGNVPFSNDIKIPYRGTTYNLHDFFFVKALDETRPGGVLALITSTGTLDKLSGKTQTAIAERANLVAALRLPDNAFSTSAGTSVTTDLIFLQRKGDGIPDNGVSFTKIGNIDGTPINEYYVEHPENILGELAYEKGMYASERTVVHATKDFEARFNKALDSLPKNIMDGKKAAGGDVSVKKRGEKTRSTFTATEKGAALVDSDGKKTELSAKQAGIVKKYMEVKSLYFNTTEAEQSGNIKVAEEYRGRLNKAYDAFVAKHGTLEANKRLLGKDDDFLRVSGLEIVDKENNVSKSAIFEKPTLYRERKTSAATSSEGLSIVLNETGGVDVDRIAALTGKTVDETVSDLENEIILTPDGNYELIPQYLSGNIYQKLDAVRGRKGFERQEELLKTALPKPKTAREIDAEISSHWIPPKYIQKFIQEQFQPSAKFEAKYIKELGRWDMQRFWSPIKKWGTSRVDAFDLLISTLNNKRIAVYDTTSDGGKVFNATETKIAQNKQNDLRSAFREWVFKDAERRADLESIFNRTLNAYAPLDFSALADKIDFDIDPDSPVKLRDYQKAAVARIVFGGNTLLHHGVGTGKTITMITAAHVLKNTGVAHKPMFVVPNGKVLDFKREILRLYPGARILALDADLLSPKELQRTKALIATNDWDYVLIHKSGFQKIGVSPETTAAFIEQQLEDLEAAIRESGANEKSGTRFEKSLITKKKNLEEKLKKILEAPRDDSTSFETMGVDALFVDEAHNFKKVGFATTQSISGVDSSTNGLTTDLYMKENWLRDRGGRIVLATATPITNTVSEMYNMTLHVNPDILREAGVYAFDGWLNTFGDLRSEMEIASDGKTFRMKERIQDFKNGNELISLYRQFADVKQTKDVVEGLPEAEEVTVVCEGSDYHQTLLDTFATRMESVGRGSKDDNALNVNNDARAAATDLRMVTGLIQELFPGVTEQDLDLPDSKVNKAVSYIVDEYHKSAKNKGTQLVFLDSGMGRGKATRYKFNLYGDLISKLVKNGIPRNEIADIGDYTGDDARQKLYDLVNAGTIRVLIGSTAKMGEGVNVQNKIVALHDLSVPMRADNLEQRHGRGIRHGNENKSVRIYKYIQEQSYDSYLWQMIERKSKYMAQALNGGDASNLEEISAVTVNAQQSKALATGNPAIMEKFKLEDEVNTLRALEKAFNDETRDAAQTAINARGRIFEYRNIAASLKKLSDVLSKNRKEDFELTVGKTTYDNRKEAAAALFVNFIKDGAGNLGSIYGLKISKYRRQTSNGTEAGIIFNGNPDSFVQFGDSPEGNITRLLNGLDRIDTSIAWYNQRIAELKKTVEDAEQTAARTQFPKAQELNEKLARLEEIDRELGIKTDEVEFSVSAAEDEDEDKVEESVRQQSISNRELLQMAAAEIDPDTLGPGEKDALRIFNEALDKLQETQERREELGRQYREQQFTKGGSREEAGRLLSAMRVLDSKIKSLENRVISLENKEVLKNVLSKARHVAEQQERQRGAEKLQNYRAKRNESEATHKYRERVRAQVLEFAKLMTSPSNKDIRKHVPAELQKTVTDFLDSIVLLSRTALATSGLDTTKADEKYLKAMKKLHDAIKENVDTQGLYSGYADLPADFIENFEAMIRQAEQHISDNSGVFVINQMSAAELKKLSQTLKTLKKYIVTMNTFHNNAMFQHVDEAGESSIGHLSVFRKARIAKVFSGAYKFLRFDYMRPSYAFEHFGDGGKSIEHELRQGQATQAFLANKIIDFAKKTYKGGEVKAWSEEIKSFTLSGGEEIKLPVTHIMSLYCLNKRAQALTHIYGDGIRVANYAEKGKVQLDEGHLVNMDDVQKMVQSLTPRQIEVADALQKYMSTECAEWGNYVSIARFDVEQFGEENYFPINSDGRYLPATADESPDNAGLYALLNMGFTKELKENASNRIILYNIFDVFANHTASMTQYRSFALPVLDALKWFNYKNGQTSVRDQLSKAFGAPEDARAGSGSKGYAESFVLNLLRAYNGTAAQGDPYDSWFLRRLHSFNRAQIAFNVRVVVQQPISIVRAAMILPGNKIRDGLAMSAVQLGKLADEMEAHSGIASWKALGFYDTNISRGLTELIKQNPTFSDNVTEAGTKGAELADRFTWAAMWYAAKSTVKRSNYDSEEAYFKAVTDLFEDTIYKTQVVDSVLTKSEFLRAKGFGARMLGSFMSEPMTTYSMLADAYFRYTDDIQQGKSASQAWQRNGSNIAKTAVIYAISQTILAAVTAVIDAWRDDDDYETFMQKYLEAFKDNWIEEMNPFSKIAGIPNMLWEALKYVGDKTGLFDKMGLNLYSNGVSNGWMQYAKYLTKGFDITVDLWKGEKTNYTKYGAFYNYLRGAAGFTGYPFATLWREVQDLWNNTVGRFAPEKKLKSYRVKDEAGIKYAVQDGYLTEEQARELLMEKGIVKNEDEAFFKVQEWASGEKKYDSMKAAIISGTSADYISAMDVLTEHGIREKDAYSAAKSFIKEVYFGDYSSSANAEIAGDKKLNDREAASALEKYAGMTRADATKLVDEWKETARFVQQHGDEYERYGLTVSQAQFYYSTAKSGGVTLETYTDQVEKHGLDTVKTYYSDYLPIGLRFDQYITYKTGYAKCKGTDNDGDGKTDSGSKKAQVMQVINSLPVSNAIKDALYLKNGWSERTMNEAPWRR